MCKVTILVCVMHTFLLGTSTRFPLPHNTQPCLDVFFQQFGIYEEFVNLTDTRRAEEEHRGEDGREDEKYSGGESDDSEDSLPLSD